jgi:signal transduction histidine kinase
VSKSIFSVGLNGFGDQVLCWVINMSRRGVALPLFRLRTAIDPQFASGRSTALAAIPASYRALTISLLVAMSYYAGSQIGFLLTPAGTPIATFWPPNAILLAALLLTSPRIWWVLILAVLPAHLFIQLRTGIPLISALSWFVGNTSEALLGAVFVRIFKKDKPLFESVHGVIVFLACGVLLPTLATSFLDAAGVILTGLGQNYWILWTTRLSSNIVSDLTIVPTIVIFGVKGLSWFRRANTSAYYEAALLMTATVVVSLLVFGRESAISGFWAFIYTPLPLLIWALLRFGSAGVSASMLAVALISVWNTMHGRGPLGLQSMVFAVLSLHYLLTVLAISSLLSGALIAERHGGEETLRAKCGNLVHAQELKGYLIARELHDNILQRLTLVSLHLDELRAASLVFTKSPLNNLYEQVSEISKTVCDLSHNLHPFMLEYLGLSRALRKLCRDAGAQCGITIEFSEHNVTSLLPLDVSGCLFRVAQEALENIVHHNRAKAAAMELKLTDRAAVLRVSVDGVGMDPLRPEGVALTCMREQVLALDGTLEIASSPSKGTVVEVSIPVKTISLIPRVG